MSNYQDIFEANQDLSEDEVVMKIYESADGDLTIKQAQAEYKTMAKDAGLIVTPQQKKVQFEDAIDDCDLSTPDGVAAARKIGKEMSIGTSTITKYLKDLASSTGVTLATPVRAVANPMFDKVVEAVSEDTALKGERSDVIELIMDTVECDEKKAGALYTKVRKHYGYVPGDSMAKQLSDWFVDNADATNKEIEAKASEIGMSDRSTQYYKNVLTIAKNLAEKLAA